MCYQGVKSNPLLLNDKFVCLALKFQQTQNKINDKLASHMFEVLWFI